MRTFDFTARLSEIDASEAYKMLSAFDQWTDYSSAIRSVQIQKRDDDIVESIWEVSFLDGPMTWTEQDFFDPVNRTCRFRHLDGMFDHLVGEWSIEPVKGGCCFRFRSEFDVGLPSLSDVLETLAEEELRNNLSSVLDGMFGNACEVLLVVKREVSSKYAN